MKELIFGALILLFSQDHVVVDKNMLLGTWLMANKNVKVQIYQLGTLYEGRVVWMDDDANEKNFSMDQVIVDEMQYNEKTHHFDRGHFYGRGKKLRCKLKLITQDSLQVKVAKGPFHATRYCTRVKP